MSAKTYCKKTAAFAGWLIQNVPEDLDEETMDNWMNNPTDGVISFSSKPAIRETPSRLASSFAMDAIGSRASAGSTTTLAGVPTIGSSSATWTLRNLGSRSLVSNCPTAVCALRKRRYIFIRTRSHFWHA